MNLKRSKYAVALLLIGTITLLAGCGTKTEVPKDNAQGKSSIKVGVVGPMTGSSVDMGLAFFQGGSLAAEEINAAGGISGRKIELVQVDDQADPNRAVTVVQKLIFEDKVTAILGPVNSGNALATEKIANDNKVIMFTNGIVQKILSDQYPYVFRSTAEDSMQNEYIYQVSKKYNKVGIIHDTAGFGQGMSDNFVKRLAQDGLKPVINESYPMNATDVTAQVLRIKNAGVDVVAWFGAASDAATVGKAMQRMGLKVPMLGNNGVFPSALKIAGTSLDGFSYADSVDLNNPRYKTFAEKYMKKYNYDRNFSQHEACEGYDTMYLMAEALKKSNGESGEALLKAVESGISIKGATATEAGGMSLSKTKRNSLSLSDLTLHEIRNGNYEMAQ